MAISAKELAHILGVSPSSISIALNGRPGISDATRCRILEAAEQYGLSTIQKNRPAVSNSNIIRLVIYRKHGFVFNDTAFFSEVLENINTSAASRGYIINITYLYEAENIAEQISDLLATDDAGYILLATEMHEEDILHFTSFPKPLVVLDNKFSTNLLNHISIDNIQGAYQAVRYLIECGHRRILHITTNVNATNLTERSFGAHLALMQENDCAIDMLRVRPSPEDACHDITDHFRSLLSDPDCRPTAVFTCSDMLAASCIRALTECGISIPDEVSIIGFDDIPLAAMTTPTLTTVHVDKSKLGFYAVKRLTDILSENDDGAINVQIGTELRIRQSVRHL